MYPITSKEMINYHRWIPWTGDLVIVGPAVNCKGKTPVLGIIIKCSNPSFGFTGEEIYQVLVDGKLIEVSELLIWPLEEENKYEYVAQGWTYESVV